MADSPSLGIEGWAWSKWYDWWHDFIRDELGEWTSSGIDKNQITVDLHSRVNIIQHDIMWIGKFHQN